MIVLTEVMTVGELRAGAKQITAIELIADLNSRDDEKHENELRALTITSMAYSQFEIILKLLVEKKRSDKIKYLNVSHNSLESIPQDIGQLTELQQLYLCRNKLTALPKEIWACKKIQCLNAEHNKIITLAEEIGGCLELKELYLMGNPIEKLPYAIGRCMALEKIFVNGPSPSMVLDKSEECKKRWEDLRNTYFARAQAIVDFFSNTSSTSSTIATKMPNGLPEIIISYADSGIDLAPSAHTFLLDEFSVARLNVLFAVCKQSKKADQDNSKDSTEKALQPAASKLLPKTTS
jgi:Leucine-rich repeat (LRR) protein